MLVKLEKNLRSNVEEVEELEERVEMKTVSKTCDDIARARAVNDSSAFRVSTPVSISFFFFFFSTVRTDARIAVGNIRRYTYICQRTRIGSNKFVHRVSRQSNKK